MYSKLWIKEFKEKKLTFILGIALSLICPAIILIFKSFDLMNPQIFKNFSYIVSWIGFFVILIFLPIFLTAPNFSAEVDRKTLHFALHLPLTRKHFWAVKFLSSLFLSFLLIVFYAIVNYAFINLSLINDVFKLYLIIIGLPALMIAITSFTSVFSSDELTASIFSIISLVITIMGLFVLSSVFQWSMSWLDIIVYWLSAIVFYSLLSYFIFNKSELLTDFVKKIKILIIYLIPVLMLASIPYSLFYTGNDFIKKYIGYNGYIAGPDFNYDKTKIYMVCQEGFFGYKYEITKLCEFSLKDGKARKFKERHVDGMLPSPVEDKIAFTVYKELYMGDICTYKGRLTGVWLKDLKKNKNKLLLSDKDIDVTEDYGSCDIIWSKDGKKIICTIIKKNSKHVDIYVFDDNGKILRNFTVAPPAIKDTAEILFPVSTVNDNLYIVFSRARYKNYALIYKISLKSYKPELIFSHFAAGGKKESEIVLFSISPDEKYMVYKEEYYDRDDRGNIFNYKERLILFNLISHEKKVLEKDEDKRVRHDIKWLGKGTLAYEYYKEEKGGRYSYDIKILNINNPESFVVIKKTIGGFSASPDGKRIIYGKIARKIAGSNNCIYSYRVFNVEDKKEYKFYRGIMDIPEWRIKWHSLNIFYYGSGINIFKVDIEEKTVQSIFPEKFNLPYKI